MTDVFRRSVTFTVPQWPADNARAWSELAERAADVSQGNGAAGGRFADVVAQVRGLLAQGAFTSVAERLGEPQFLRALFTVWVKDDFAWAFMPSLFPVARQHLLERPRRQTTLVLAALFWRVFDRLDGVATGLFADVGGTLHEAARRIAVEHDLTSPLGVVANAPGYWLRSDAPKLLAHHLLSVGESLDDHFRATGVAGIEGRFGILVRREYYFAAIARADHTARGHAFLGDVTRDAVKAAETEDDLSFGHGLLAALCDKPVTLDPSPEWLEAITGIGGDPRLRETAQWRRWWASVPEQLVRTAARWMVGADLQVYFDALDDYAATHGSDAMRRMLPARTTFLKGLYHSGLVDDVRLILGDDVRRGIRQVRGGAPIDAARYTGTNANETAVVVLMCGGFTVVEGSHNFQMYLYAGEPVPMLVDRRRRTYTTHDLKETVPARHYATHGDGRQEQYRHNEIWQPKALAFLRGLGVNFDPRAVYSAADYEKQRRRELYGAAPYTTYQGSGGYRR